MNRRQVLMAMAAATTAATGMRAVWASPFSAPLTLNGALALTPVIVRSGMPVSFLVDTGAATTAVDGLLAGSLGLDRFLPRSGPVRGPSTRIIAAGRTATIEPAIVDLRPIASALDQAVLGLLGSDFLSAFQVIIDFSAKRLTLGDGGQAKPPDALPMRFSGMPFVSVEVRNGRSTLQGEFGLDTGLDSGVKIKETMTTPMMGLAISDASIVTMEGVKSVQGGTVDAVRVGGMDVVSLSAVVSQDPAPKGAGQTYAGTIGAHAFQNRVLTLDYPGGWWALSPVIL